MFIAIDVGNTRIHLGAYEGDKLLSKLSLEIENGKCPKKKDLDAFLKPLGEIEDVGIASVVSKTSAFFEYYFVDRYHLKPHFITAKTPLDMKLDCDVPDEVGPDLIADSYGARVLFGKDVLIADAGTASKLIYLDHKGDFKGVSILPGLRMGLKALYQGTDALPSIQIRESMKAIGTNTEECILSGVLFGGAYALEGLAKRFESEASFIGKRILTGGNAVFLSPILKGFECVEDLALFGIKEIRKYAKGEKHAKLQKTR